LIVLDTHAWLWWLAEPRRLSGAAREAIGRAEALGVATISCWEVGMLAARGRISLDRDVEVWVRQALITEPVRALELTGEIAVRAALLDPREFVGDPADRIIYATARESGSALVSRDRAMATFDPQRVVW